MTDFDGNIVHTLGNVETNEDGALGAISAAFETDNGFIVVDSNYRALYFWDKDGGFIKKVRAEDLFGTSYPWMSGVTMDKDGSLVFVMSQKRDDKSEDELLVFRLSGF